MSEEAKATPTVEDVPKAVRHCADTYKACCLPWGWCNCICGDCRVAKYAQEAARQYSWKESNNQ